MTPPSAPPRPMRFLRSGLTLATGMLVLSVVLFGFAVAYGEAEFRTWSQYDALRDSIIAASPIKADSFNVNNRSSAEALAVSRSSRAGELQVLQARQRRQNLTAIGFGVASLVALVASLVFAGHFVRRYWRGEGVPPAQLAARRADLQARATIAVATILVGLIVLWRYLAGERPVSWIDGTVTFVPRAGLREYLVALTAVVVGAVLLVWLVWRVLASPTSRVSHAVSRAPKLYRSALQGALFAAATLWAASDLSRISSQWFLGLQMVGWLAVVVALSSVLLAYLTPRKLVPETSVPVTGTTGTELVEPERADAAAANGDGDGDGRRRRMGVSPWPRESRPDLTRIAAQVDEIMGRMEQARVTARPATPDEALRIQADRMRHRLQEELQSLTTRGNLNLSIGIATTLLAVGILWWLVLEAPDRVGTDELLSYYLPRFSVAVFIEVFSFFFLRLYRNGLADIKYYQNEMTTIESRILALEVAVMSQRPEPVDEMLRGLSAMDRNMVLRQGETTAELERLRIEQQNLRTVVDGMVSRIPAPSSTPQGTGTGAAVG